MQLVGLNKRLAMLREIVTILPVLLLIAYVKWQQEKNPKPSESEKKQRKVVLISLGLLIAISGVWDAFSYGQTKSQHIIMLLITFGGATAALIGIVVATLWNKIGHSKQKSAREDHK